MIQANSHDTGIEFQSCHQQQLFGLLVGFFFFFFSFFPPSTSRLLSVSPRVINTLCQFAFTIIIIITGNKPNGVVVYFTGMDGFGTSSS